MISFYAFYCSVFLANGDDIESDIYERTFYNMQEVDMRTWYETK